MWSFDDEENKQNGDSTENPTPPPEENDDNFGERDPFSRGGDFYTNYNGVTGEPREPKNKKQSGKGGAFLAILLCAAIFLVTAAAINLMGDKMSLGGLVLGTTTENTLASTQGTNGKPGSTAQTTQGTTATAPGIVPGTNTSPTTPSYVNWDAAVVEKCLNASVLITVSGVGSGSGVIYTQDGYILTNYHVVNNNNNAITVTLFSGEKLPATFIYGDSSNDVSVIKIDKSDCIYATVSASPVSYMMPVMVIGNALGKGFNTTQGVVSAPASEVYFSSTYETMTLIRVDAAINSGNSGGGLFNAAGELVGLVNAKTSGASSSGALIENMGYAIPMSTVMKCVNDLKNYGYVTGAAHLGATASNYLRIGGTAYSLVVVESVTPGGSFEKSGVQKDDILVALNGKEISSFQALEKMITAYSVGDTVELLIKRPTEEAKKQTNAYRYWEACKEIKIKLTFVEFNPNAK
jgi:serine protease Do